jgi:hypothetical protein
MVRNRRATKKGGKVNPAEAWLWSEQPTHEAIVTREVFEAAMGMTELRKRSRNGSGPNVERPALVAHHFCGFGDGGQKDVDSLAVRQLAAFCDPVAGHQLSPVMLISDVGRGTARASRSSQHASVGGDGQGLRRDLPNDGRQGVALLSGVYLYVKGLLMVVVGLNHGPLACRASDPGRCADQGECR